MIISKSLLASFFSGQNYGSGLPAPPQVFPQFLSVNKPSSAPRFKDPEDLEEDFEQAEKKFEQVINQLFKN